VHRPICFLEFFLHLILLLKLAKLALYFPVLLFLCISNFIEKAPAACFHQHGLSGQNTFEKYFTFAIKWSDCGATAPVGRI